MPTSAPGSEIRPGTPVERGFTLLELIIVIAIIALASAVASVAMSDPAATRLEREGQRLALLLEAGRAQSRALGVPIRWEPGAGPPGGGAARPGERIDPDADFRFTGAPDLGRDAALPTRFLESQAEGARVSIELANRPEGIVLGPEPLIGAQRIVLRLNDHRLILASDGLGPFAVVTE